MPDMILTIGHSTHSQQKLVTLLQQHGVTAVADVRSHPYSRLHPQFNREALSEALKRERMAYVFLGTELGARATNPECYEQGKVQYSRLAGTVSFQEGLKRLVHGTERYRIAVLCAERDPLACHRGILISRHLVGFGIDVQHILADGRIEIHNQALLRLLSELGLAGEHLFRDRDALVAAAYEMRGEQIAYVVKPEQQRERRKVTNE